MPLYIREGRFGPPKSFKTGAVVSSYPKPMLVFEFDPGGLDIAREPILYITVEALPAYCEKKSEELPPLMAIDFSILNKDVLLSANYVPTPDTKTFPAFVEGLNALRSSKGKLRPALPWKTIVFDALTGLSDSIYGHQSATDIASLADARKWAGRIGMKVLDMTAAIVTLPCHTVTIMHSEIDKDELGSEIRELPMLYSKLRWAIGRLFSQFFYAFKEGSTAYIRTADFGLTKGIGPRVPSGLKEKNGPLFDDIYKGVKFE